jgi:hypothetical protein
VLAESTGLHSVVSGRAFCMRHLSLGFDLSMFGISVKLYGEQCPIAFGVIRAFKKIADKNYGSEYARRNFASTAMVRSLEDSLRRMGTDYVDRLLIHEPLQPLESNEAQNLFEQVEVALGRVCGGIALFRS